MHYCFVWKKWQWLVSLWMEANLCLNTGGCRVVRGGLSGGRWRGQAVYWELDQWQVNPHWGKLFIFVKAFLLHSHRGPTTARKGNDSLICKGNVILLRTFPPPPQPPPPHPAPVRKYLLGLLRGRRGCLVYDRVPDVLHVCVLPMSFLEMRKVYVLFA